MSAGDALRVAVEAKVGRVQPDLVEDLSDTEAYDALLRVYGDNASIARAAGYGEASTYPRGSAGWKRRQALMADLRRYNNDRLRRMGLPHGQARRPVKMEPRLRSLAASGQRKQATPRTVRDVIRLMGMKGTTTSLVIVKFRYEPNRKRELEVRVYTQQSVYREVRWPMRGRKPPSQEVWADLEQKYLEAYCIAYGIPGDLPAQGVADDPVFTFVIGREQPIDYEES